MQNQNASLNSLKFDKEDDNILQSHQVKETEEVARVIQNLNASLNSELEDAKRSNAMLREELRAADQGNAEPQDNCNQLHVGDYHYLYHQVLKKEIQKQEQGTHLSRYHTLIEVHG